MELILSPLSAAAAQGVVRVCTGVGLGTRDSRTRNRVRGARRTRTRPCPCGAAAAASIASFFLCAEEGRAGGGSFLSLAFSLSLSWGRVARFSFLSLHLFSLLPVSLSFFPFCFLSLGVFSYTKLMVCV